MGIIKATIGVDDSTAVDVSAYLKSFTVDPGSAGVVGKATLVLDQEAGGLDLRPRMNVKVWVPFDTIAGTGIAASGRLFGGLIGQRQTGNVGVTKTWGLQCEDWNALFDLLQRDQAGASAITLTAGTFAAQVTSVVQQIQFRGGGSVRTQIDSVSGVANLYATMPATTLEPGHSLGYYLQALCNTVKRLSPSVLPRFYMAHGSTFGAVDTFGQATLWVFDAALSPSPAISFSDTPTGGQKPIYPSFIRTTDGTGARIIQRRQGQWGMLVYTSVNDTSQALYPNPFINHSKNPGGNSGYWGAPPITIQATTTAEAQAAVDSSVASTANPSDTFQFRTEERVQPYDPIELTWALDGISAQIYRPARLNVTIEGLTLVTNLQLNNRRRGLLDDGSDEYPQTPREGDTVAPLAPGQPAVPTEVWDSARQIILLTTSATPSPSPDALRYEVEVTHSGGSTTLAPISDISNFTVTGYPDNSTGIRVRAIDSSGNIGDFSTVRTVANPGSTIPYFFNGVPNWSFEQQKIFAADTEPAWWDNLSTGTATAQRKSDFHAHGDWSLKLVPGASGVAKRRTKMFLPVGDLLSDKNLKFRYKSASGSVTVTWRIFSWTWTGSSWAGVDARSGMVTATTTEQEAVIFVDAVLSMSYVTIEFETAAASTSVWIDKVQLDPIGRTEDQGDATITSAKLATTGVVAKTYTLPKISINAQGQATAATDQSGTAFPGSPSSGDFFYRTDLGVLCWFNSGLWLGPERSIAWSHRNTTQPFSVNGDVVAEYRIRSASTIYLKAWAISTHVVTTNSGSAFWTVALLKASDASDITTKNTSADAPNTWVEQAEVTSFTGNPYTYAGVQGFAVQVRKTGAPGNIYLDQELIYHVVYT